MATLFDKLDPVIQRYHEIEDSMGDPEIAANFECVQELARERASLENLVKIGREYKGFVAEIVDLEILVRDGSEPELIEMAKEELDENRAKLEELTQALQLALQNNALSAVLAAKGEAPKIPTPIRWLLKFRILRNIPARIIGYGFDREDVE